MAAERKRVLIYSPDFLSPKSPALKSVFDALDLMEIQRDYLVSVQGYKAKKNELNELVAIPTNNPKDYLVGEVWSMYNSTYDKLSDYYRNKFSAYPRILRLNTTTPENKFEISYEVRILAITAEQARLYQYTDL